MRIFQKLTLQERKGSTRHVFKVRMAPCKSVILVQKNLRPNLFGMRVGSKNSFVNSNRQIHENLRIMFLKFTLANFRKFSQSWVRKYCNYFHFAKYHCLKYTDHFIFIISNDYYTTNIGKLFFHKRRLWKIGNQWS